MKIVQQWDKKSVRREISAGTEEQRRAVLRILDQVRQEGDKALYRFTETFDGVKLSGLKVSEEEIKAAYTQVDKPVLQALQEAIDNVRRFHEQQKQSSWIKTSASGTVLGQLVRPLQRVGVYVPGGTAAYPSSLLMSVIPAQVAGVADIAVVSPPDSSGRPASGVLVAADLLGIRDVYKLGGAQAIAALAFGTASVPRVDKIVGPGNVYVALAKREVFGLVDIDMIAGPTDVLVVADEHQHPAYIAADLLAQAEHDPLSAAVCITPSMRLAERIQAEVQRQLVALPRREIAARAIDEQGVIYVTETLAEAMDLANEIAPEHLELLVAEPFNWLGSIKNAGAIFLGEHSSEPVGDYFAGPSHVLPTNGTARFSSGLGVDAFLKKSSIVAYSASDLKQHGEKIMRMARYEGLEAHARAIQIRLETEKARNEND